MDDAERKKREKREKQEKAESEYKRSTRSLTTLNRNEDVNKIQGVISQKLDLSSNLYPVIKKRLTGSAADARHFKTLMHLSNETAKRINASSRPFNLRKLVQREIRQRNEDFRQVFPNQYALNCLKIQHTFEFFYGAINKEGLVPKERRKRAKIEFVPTKAITATEKNIATDVEQDSTPKEVEAIYNRVRNLIKSKPDKVQFFQTIVDPSSFTQTVENIFHTSFLIKEGKIGVKKGTDNRPILTYEEGTTNTQDRTIVPKQSILSFTMADYNKWKSKQK